MNNFGKINELKNFYKYLINWQTDIVEWATRKNMKIVYSFFLKKQNYTHFLIHF